MVRRNTAFEIYTPIYGNVLTSLLNLVVSLPLEWQFHEEKDHVCFIKNMYKHHSAWNRVVAQ